MKKKYYLFALAFLGLTLTSCGKTGGVGLDYDDVDLNIDTPWTDYSVPVTKVNFESGEDSIEINKGETHEYQYSLEPAKAKKNSLSWSSSNERVATVDKGVVTAVAPGDTEVTVYNDIESFEPVTLNVKVNSPLQDISFSSASLAADFEHSYDLASDLLVYTPSDTTQKGVSWSVDCPNSIAEIDPISGVLTTKSTTSNIVVTARSEYINKAITLNVEIADRTIYPSSVVVDEYISQIEIGHNVQFTAHAVASDPTQAVTHPEIKYYSENTDILIVEEETGVVHAVGEGDTRIYAVASNGVQSEHLPVNVFEVKVNSIILDDVTLSNRNGRTDVSVDFTYTTDTAGYEVASMPNFTYSTGDESVATVNSNGKLFAVADNGDTTLTVTETRSGVSKTVNLHVCFEVDTVTIKATSSTILVGSTTQLSVSTTPGGVPASYTSFSSSDESVATVSETGLVTAVKEGEVEISATVLGVTGKVTLNVELPDIPFDANYSYVVGNKNYASGTSTASVTGSWDKANQAKRVDNKVQDAHDTLLYERRAIIYFREGDIWKLRSANGSFGSPYGYLEPNGWPEGATYQLGEYKAEGALVNGDMSVNKDNNIVVNREGWYAIYHAQYANDNPLGWYSIYVGRHELNISDTTPTVKIGTYVDIQAHDWAGNAEDLTFQVTQGSDLITVSRGTGDLNYQFRILAGETAGTAVIKFTDGFKTVDVIVTISEEDPPAKTWEADIPYIVGNADYHSGIALGEGSYWGDHPEKAFKAVESHAEKPAGVYKQYEAEIEFKAGNEFQVVIGGETLYWDAVYETKGTAFETTPAQMSRPNKDVIVNIAGTYKMYIKSLENFGGWEVFIAPTEGGDPDPEYDYDYYLIGVGGNEDIKDEFGFSKDTSDNHYYLENVTLAVGDLLKANNPATGAWLGVSNNYQDYWEVSDDGKNNMKVLVAGSYTVSLYPDSTDGNYLRLDPTIPPDPTIAEYTANIKIDPALATWSPAVSDVSLYLWTNDGSQPLGDWNTCKGNLNNGTVTLTYNKAVTHFILYFTQSGGTLQTADLTCDLRASGDYIIDISGHDWKEGKMIGVVIRVDEGGGDDPVTTSDYYLKGDFNSWVESADYKFVATSDSNKYTLTNVTIQAGQGMKGYKPASGSDTEVWYGVSQAYSGCGWTVDTRQGHEGDCVVTNTAIYTVNLYVNGTGGNHLEIIKTGDVPTPSTLKTYYFTNNYNWNSLKVYVWNSTTQAKPADWPGLDMTYVYTNDMGQAVYSITIDTSLYNYVIFNSGDVQTVDIALSKFGTNNACYISGGSGKQFTVGYWNYQG